MKRYFHPILASIFPVLFFYSFNQNQLNLKIIIVPLFFSAITCILFWLLIRVILRSWDKSSVLTTIFTIWFYSYGHLSNSLKNIFIPIGPKLVLGPDKILLPFGLIILTFVVRFIIKSQKSFNTWNKFMTIFMSVLILIQIANILPKISDLFPQNANYSQASTSIIDTPDIYFIVLDGYARADILKNIYNYDNNNFLTGLKKMNFTVVDDARANYSQTFFSLSSTLNMKHVNYLAKDLGKKSTDVNIPFQMIGDNEVAKILKSRGYKVINLASGWGPTDKLAIADINYDEGKSFNLFGQKININEFYIVFLQTTALSPFIKNTLMDQSRAKVISGFNKLVDIPYLRGHKFVLAHFNVPHPPYLFDEVGNSVPNQLLEMAGESFSDRTNYLNQLKFVNRQITNSLVKIISNSSQPPIIILQSDHGPASIMGHPYKWTRPAPEDGIEERMSILSAFYLPKTTDINSIPKTPVNNFRFILNQYFGGSYEYLPDTSYFSDYNSIYEFFEVKN